jgi:hypothetical protein
VEKEIFSQTYQAFLKRMESFRNSGIDTWNALKPFKGQVEPFLRHLTQIGKTAYSSFHQDIIPYLKDKTGRVDIIYTDLSVIMEQSNIHTRDDHKITVNFITTEYLLVHTIADSLLLSPIENIEVLKAKKTVETFVIKLDKSITICSLQVL